MTTAMTSSSLNGAPRTPPPARNDEATGTSWRYAVCWAMAGAVVALVILIALLVTNGHAA